MNRKLSFEELAQLGDEILAKQRIAEQSNKAKEKTKEEKQPITDEEIQRILNETYGCDSM